MAPTDSSPDALAEQEDLDPQSFLIAVRELSEKKEREDEERYRKLEEEVIKGREERAARRAERARSISPEKANTSTPSNRSTRTLSRTTTNASLASPPPSAMTPPSSVGSRDNVAHSESLHRLTGSSQSSGDPEKTTPKVGDVPDFKGFSAMKRSSTMSASSATTTPSTQRHSVPDPDSAPSATNLARSGTLSWQQRRPTSRLGGSSSRPLSVVATHNSAAHSKTASIDEPEPSRDQIAASLGARDPSWFKQTAERGIGSAAYRKSKEEAGMEETVSPGRRGLPGLSRETTDGAERHASPPTSESINSESVSRNSQRESVYSTGSRFSATSSSSSTKPDLRSLIAADEGQRRVSPSFVSEQGSAASGDSGGLTRSVTMSSSQARLANGTDRPASPTKGMGGFVQSAMMKRSDSQSKRWSAQPSTSVSRHNSVASARSGHSALPNSHSMPRLDTAETNRESLDEKASRPESPSKYDNPEPASQDGEVFVKPALPRHSRSKSVASTYSTNDDLPQSPGSPSKRFSPNKSSWIESSLTKPESPKLAPSKNSAPSWMADLASRKAQRASADSTPPIATSPYAEREELRAISRPGSPLKNSPFGPSLLKRPESRDLTSTPGSATPMNKFKTAQPSDKDSGSPFVSSPSPVKSSFASPDPTKSSKAPDVETAEAGCQSLQADSAVTPVVSEKAPQVTQDNTKSATSRPLPAPERPSTPEVTTTRPRAKSFRSPPAAVNTQLKSETITPKVPNDFRSQLKSRPPPQMKVAGQPEFLSKFGNLRKTQPEKFVAPDVLKDNILRGKSGLAVSSGPVKTERKDELRDSLLAKKDDIKKAKDEGRDLPGQMHERKTSQVAQEPPPKPEALSRRELLGRSDSGRNVQTVEKTREATPEALARHKSLKHKPATVPLPDDNNNNTQTEPKMDALSKQISAPSSVGSKQSEQTSKLAARFNPGLAGLLARGPPSAAPSRTASPATVETLDATPSAAVAGPLQDMRKDRAKGPRRKGGAKAPSGKGDAISTPVAAAQPDKTTEIQPLLLSPKAISATEPTIPAANASLTRSPPLPSSPNFSRPKPSAAMANKQSTNIGSYQAKSSEGSRSSTPQLDGPPDSPIPVAKAKPQALPGSAASILAASLKKTDTDQQPANLTSSELKKPFSPAKIPSPTSKSSLNFEKASADSTAVPEFKGFGSMKKQRVSQPSDADKENTDDSGGTVKAATSFWGRRMSPQQAAPAAPIQLPTKKDEDAAMRSAGLLASKTGLGITADETGEKTATPPTSAGLPPKPAKSSRVASGQLAEASPNKGPSSSGPAEQPLSEAGRLLLDAFGSVPKSRGPLSITASAVISGCEQASDTEEMKSSRKTVSVVYPDGSFKSLPPQEESTLFDESVFVCTNAFTDAKGIKASQVFMWIGDAAFGATADAANVHAKRLARESGATAVTTVRQGRESASFLQAFGGILITRRQSRETANKQYMLCGRKHLGHIVFDEVDFGVGSLHAGYVYLISFPLTLQETKMYLWKGSGCSVEELSAARLAAMDLSETGDIIEVDGGAEFSSFLKIFGPSTTKSDVPMTSGLWKQKALAPDKFEVRLFKVQQPEMKNNLITSLWLRRPSWNRLSPARAPAVPLEDVKVEVKHMSPFTQAQLEAEGIYLLDAYCHLYIIIGSLFASQGENIRVTLLAQALLFASDYATMSASLENRIAIPKCSVLFSGVPDDVKVLFRHWDDSRGLWGTAGLMAGASVSQGRELKIIPLEDVLTEVCRD